MSERASSVANNERALVAMMFTISLLLVAAQTATKAARDALFLTHFGLTELCYLMIALAFIAGAGIAVFERLSRNAPRNRVIVGLYLFVAATLAAISFGVETHQVWWLCWFLYLWSGVFALMTLAEFWLLANVIFEARQGKRLFGLLGSGAILGGLVGGFSSAWLVHAGGTKVLLRVAAGEFVVAALLSHVVWSRRTLWSEEPARPPPPASLKTLWNQPYIRLIGALTLCMVICLTLIEWQYKAIAKLHFGTRTDDMAAFFGWVAGVVNVVVFVVQSAFTSRLLHYHGAPAMLRLLPGAAGLGSLLLLLVLVTPLSPLVAATVALMLSDSLRFSVDKASLELVYMPIHDDLRDHARRIIDIFVDRFGGALAALLWLALSFTLHIERARHIVYPSFLVLAIVAAWWWLARSVRVAYLQAYRSLVVGEDRPLPPPSAKLAEWAKRQLRSLSESPRERTSRLRKINHKQVHVAPLRLEAELVEPHLVKEVAYAKQLRRAQSILRGQPEGLSPRLLRTLDLAFGGSLERVGRLLSLVYPPRDIYHTHLALQAKSPRMRAAAVELIDALVDSAVKHDLVEILEEVALQEGPPPSGGALAVLDDLSRDVDPLLRELARPALARMAH